VGKQKAPILSLGAAGTIGGTITYQHIHRTNIARKKPIPTDPQTDLQLDRRSLYRCVCYMWHSLIATEKQQWETDARRHRITGFNLYMRTYLLLLANPLALYPFAKGTGATAYDYSRNGHHAAIFGAVWKYGDFKPYLQFDGVDDKVQMPINAFNLGIAHSGAIEACITPAANTFRAIINDYHSPSKKGIHLRIGAANSIVFYGFDLVEQFSIVTTRTLTMGQKHVVRAYYTGTQAFVYVDGELWGQSAQTGDIGSSPYGLAIGRRPWDNWGPFKRDFHYIVLYQP